MSEVNNAAVHGGPMTVGGNERDVSIPPEKAITGVSRLDVIRDPAATKLVASKYTIDRETGKRTPVMEDGRKFPPVDKDKLEQLKKARKERQGQDERQFVSVDKDKLKQLKNSKGEGQDDRAI